MTEEQRQYLTACRDRYLGDFRNDIMPFWLKYGLDRKNGGVFTCLDRDGTLMDSTKSVWFQGRFGFIAAYAYNNIEKNPEWLAASKSCIDFIENHCFDTDGHMFFTVTAEGRGKCTTISSRLSLRVFVAVILTAHSIGWLV